MSTQKICTAAHRIASRPASQVARPASAFESGVSRILAVDSEVPGGSDFFWCTHVMEKTWFWLCMWTTPMIKKNNHWQFMWKSPKYGQRYSYFGHPNSQSSRCQEEFQSNWSGKIMWFCKGCVTWMASTIHAGYSGFHFLWRWPQPETPRPLRRHCSMMTMQFREDPGCRRDSRNWSSQQFSGRRNH